jgi:hypothetical protein
MTRRCAGWLVLLAMAVSGGYAAPSVRLFAVPRVEARLAERAEPSETQARVEEPPPAPAPFIAPNYEAPAPCAPHLHTLYQRPPPAC